MGNNITDGLKYKESVVKFSKKYGVAKAAYKFGECKRTIYTRIISCNAKIRNIQKDTKQKERK